MSRLFSWSEFQYIRIHHVELRAVLPSVHVSMSVDEVQRQPSTPTLSRKKRPE